MGADRTTVQTTSNQTSTPTPTAEETELNRLDLDARRSNQQGMIDIQKNALGLGNLLLQGLGLPGYLSGLPGGISPDVTQGIVDESLRDVKSFANQGGILDSGTAASIAGRTSGDIRMGSAQFNLQNLMQLLNLAVGGQAQIQQPVIGMGAALGQRLAGLRSVNQTGGGSQTTTAMNPFMKSFQTSLGSSLGSFGYSQRGGMTFGGQ